MPYSIYKIHEKNCYGVINSETGKIHSYCTTLPKAEAQVRILQQATKGEGKMKLAIMKKEDLVPLPQGEGIIEDVVKGLSKINPFKKRQAGLLPPKSRELLSKIQNEPITSMIVVRTPIESYINKTLQLVSGGKWQDAVAQTGYDTLFHLSLYINNKYVFHKIEVTTLAQENPIKSDSQTMNVPLTGTNITIGDLVENTKKSMGLERFTNYDPKSENCQDFVSAVLEANKLSNPELLKFVKQDAVSIFNKTPKWTSYVAKFVTDLGARFNRLTQGESLSNKKQNQWVMAVQEYYKQNPNKKKKFPKKGTEEYTEIMKIYKK